MMYRRFAIQTDPPPDFRVGIAQAVSEFVAEHIDVGTDTSVLDRIHLTVRRYHLENVEVDTLVLGWRDWAELVTALRGESPREFAGLRVVSLPHQERGIACATSESPLVSKTTRDRLALAVHDEKHPKDD
jgi:hypothetical protein